MRQIRAVFCWSHPSGYMAACWRELAAKRAIDLAILAFEPDGTAPFDPSLFSDLPIRWLRGTEASNDDLVESTVAGMDPDVIVLAGWWWAPYRRLVDRMAQTRVRFVMGVDTPYDSFVRRRVRGWLRKPLLRKMALIVVPGEKGRLQLIESGIDPEMVSTGLYGIDYEMFSQVSPRRAEGAAARAPFLFVGRLVRDKGIDTLALAYRAYRDQAPNPRPLLVCGDGPLSPILEAVDGVTLKGFVQPEELTQVYAAGSALILPSTWEPWGQVIAEACAAGLPIVCSDKCGAAFDLVRDRFNGAIVAPKRPHELTAALLWIDEQLEREPGLGRRSRRLAEPYSAQHWADRWLVYLTDSVMGAK